MFFSNFAYVAAGFLFGGVIAGSLWLVVYLARMKFNQIRRQWELEQICQEQEAWEAWQQQQAVQAQPGPLLWVQGHTDHTAAESLPEVESDLSQPRFAAGPAARHSGANPDASPCAHRWKDRRACASFRRGLRPSRSRR